MTGSTTVDMLLAVAGVLAAGLLFGWLLMRGEKKG